MLRNRMTAAAILALIAVRHRHVLPIPSSFRPSSRWRGRRPPQCFNTDRATPKPLTCSFRAAMVRIHWPFSSMVDAGARPLPDASSCGTLGQSWRVTESRSGASAIGARTSRAEVTPAHSRMSARQLTGCDPMLLVMVWISRARSWSGTPRAGISHSGQRCGTGCRQAVLSTVLSPSYPTQSSVSPGLAILKPSHASCRSSAGRELSSDWPLQWIRQIDMPRFRRRPCRHRAFPS